LLEINEKYGKDATNTHLSNKKQYHEMLVLRYNIQQDANRGIVANKCIYGKDATTIHSSIKKQYPAMLALSYNNQQDVNRGIARNK
jgi:hypothetical protein